MNDRRNSICTGTIKTYIRHPIINYGYVIFYSKLARLKEIVAERRAQND